MKTKEKKVRILETFCCLRGRFIRIKFPSFSSCFCPHGYLIFYTKFVKFSHVHLKLFSFFYFLLLFHVSHFFGMLSIIFFVQGRGGEGKGWKKNNFPSSRNNLYHVYPVSFRFCLTLRREMSTWQHVRWIRE